MPPFRPCRFLEPRLVALEAFLFPKDHSKALPPVSTMADQLAKLGLISKVCTELEKHIGMSDKNLAEFVLHLAKESKYDRNAFSKSLKANGANFPDALFETLYTIICAKKVSHGEKNTTKNQGLIAAVTPLYDELWRCTCAVVKITTVLCVVLDSIEKQL